MSRPQDPLALLGGPPVHASGWPSWPRSLDPEAALAGLRRVLGQPRWTVRGTTDPAMATRRFERAWAEGCERPYCLAVSSGSAALECAFKALRIGPGDEVVVPALGWYATAAAVSRVGARPVFADVDPATSCLSPESAAAALTARTAAVVAVHLHCAVADLDGLLEVARRREIPLVEDAAQAHGGAFHGRPVGGVGTVGCFSFNQEKGLAAGEGGALVTGDEALYRRLHASRTDGYLPPRDGRSEIPNGALQGANACLSELQASLLLSQLDSFDEEFETRQTNGAALCRALDDVPGVRALATTAGTTRRPWYEFGMILDREVFGGWSLELLGRALAAELGAPVHPTDPPVPWSPLFAPGADGSAAVPSNARRLFETLLVFHHRLLLDPAVLTAVPQALQKVAAAARRQDEESLLARLNEV